MGEIGLPELIVVLVIALLVFGPSRVPDMGRSLGRALREFRAALRSGDAPEGGKPSLPAREVKAPADPAGPNAGP